MKVQSNIFVLFLVASFFLSSCSWAQTYSIPAKSELEASQEAQQFGEAVRKNELQPSEAQKSERRSADAMHWNVSSEKQDNPLTPTASQKPATLKKLTTYEANTSNQINKSIKTVEKPTYGRL